MSDIKGQQRARRTGPGMLVAVAAAAFLLAGCDDDPEADVAARLCGILDPAVAAEATGGAVELTGFGGGNLDAKRRQGNGVDCSVATAGGERRFTIVTMDFSDQADREAMRKQFADESAGSDVCAPRTGEPVGYVCRLADETRISVLFPDRFVRVYGEARVNGQPPDPEALIAVARNVDANLRAFDEGR